MEFQVGQEVWRRASSNASRYRTDPWERVKVTRIGRKYVYAKADRDFRETRYDTDGHEVTEYSGSATSIFTDEERVRFERHQAARDGLQQRHRAFDITTRGGYSTETLEQVLALLDADKAARA